MKSEERIKTQRDWMWLMAEHFEQIGFADGPDAESSRVASHEFAILTGALDWVLRDED